MEKVNLQEKFRLFDEYWSPKIAGELNGQHVKLAKLKGEFVWHSHEKEDEMFLVVKGKLRIEFRDKNASTVNTGNINSDRTVKNLEHI